MPSRTIRQTVIVAATPGEIYRVLMTSQGHSKLTDSPARISSRVGGKFTAYDGYIEGKNLKLVPGKRIVQEWRASDWQTSACSTVTFEFSKTKQGTKISFLQTGVPSEQYDSIRQGWTDYYWDPLKKMFGGDK